MEEEKNSENFIQMVRKDDGDNCRLFILQILESLSSYLIFLLFHDKLF